MISMRFYQLNQLCKYIVHIENANETFYFRCQLFRYQVKMQILKIIDKYNRKKSFQEHQIAIQAVQFSNDHVNLRVL